MKDHRSKNAQFRRNIREWYSQNVVVGVRKRPRDSIEENTNYVKAWCANDEKEGEISDDE